MRLVIDTNVMVESITAKSPHNQIFRSLTSGQNYLAVSNEIFLEYFEVFARIYSRDTLQQISLFFKVSPVLLKIDPHYHFHLIHSDEDDNKFVDCAICGNCDFLITSDHHFDVLKEIPYPKVEIITPGDFIKEYL